MALFGASDATLQLACDYFRIVVCFFPAYLMFNVMNSMIRADGSPTYAMVALLLGAVINIILDPVFIFALDWGIQGAAIATVIGQVVAQKNCLSYLLISFFIKSETIHQMFPVIFYKYLSEIKNNCVNQSVPPLPHQQKSHLQLF